MRGGVCNRGDLRDALSPAGDGAEDAGETGAGRGKQASWSVCVF